MNDPFADLAPTLQSHHADVPQYLPSSHQQVLSKLEHLGRYSPVVQILTGPQGSGKTTLLKQLSNSFPHQEAISISIEASYETDKSELLSTIAEELNLESLSTIDSATLFSQITKELQNLKLSHRFLFIQIDNGESLNNDALSLLLKTFQELNENIRPHLLIAGQSVLADKIKNSPYAASIPENLSHYAALPSLDVAEVTAFIQHYFPDEAEVLNESRIAHVHQRSLGLPGQIEKALQREIANPASTTEKLNIGKIASTSLLTILLLAISGGASYMLWGLYTQPSFDNEQVRITLPAPIEQPKLKQTTSAPISPVPEPTPDPDLTKLDSKVAITKPLTNTASTLDTSTDAITDTLEKTNSDSPDNLTIAQTANPPSDTEEQPPVLTTPAKNKLVLQLKPSEPKQPNSTAKSLDKTQVIALSTQQIPVEAKAKLTVIRPSNPLLREDELLSWDSNGYTLQMLGARKESSVISFIQSMSGRSDFYYFSTIYKEKPWYVVVYGQYQNRDKAVAAIRSLPSDLKKQKPWARSINGVQDDIRRK